MSLPKLPPVSRVSHSVVRYDSEVDSLTKNTFFQNGRSYVLSESKVVHELPAPNKLRPYIDRNAGETDTWPAHSTKPPSFGAENIHTPKPKFLQKIESYLQKELRALGCKTSEPTEKRLQVFREAFEYLIEDFRTYKPILSAIKSEYESMMAAQKETIRNLEPLKWYDTEIVGGGEQFDKFSEDESENYQTRFYYKAMLVNINDQCEQKVLNLKQEEKQDLINLKHENEDLRKIIASLQNEIAGLKMQVKKCQDEVAQEYEKYRNESDSRKLLIQDMNDLKYQQDEAKRALAASGDDEDGKKEDGVMLRIALRKAREDLDLKTHRLAEVMADYGDVVPRREFEKLETQFKNMEDDFETIKKDHEELMKEHSALLDVHKQVMAQRDEFATDCETMRRSATPRPDWGKCALYIEGGAERWVQLSNETTTCDKVDILLSEMTGQDISIIKAGGGAMVDFFESKGTGPDIPAYLRSDDRVRNRRLTKRDLSIMIKDIWQEKMKKEGSVPFTAHSNMAEFLHEYLQQRFGVATMVTEWGYNIHDGVTRYNFDVSTALFGDILNDQVDEDVYYSQLSKLEQLYKTFVKADTKDTGFLPKEDFSSCLQSDMPHSTNEEISSILHAAEDELSGFQEDKVSYRDLFTEDDEGKSGPFITCLQDFIKHDREKYLTQIENHLGNKSELTTEELKEAIQAVDRNVSQQLCGAYVALGFQGHSDSEQTNEKLSKDDVMRNLRRSCITRT